MAAEAPPINGDLLTKKLGPLPTWGWMGVGLGGVLVWRWQSSRKAAAAVANTTTTPTAGYKLPTNIPPQFTQVNEDTFSNIGNTNSGNTSTVNNPPPVINPAPVSVPVPTPPAPNGHYVIVTKYRHGDEKRHGIPSSPWGIAEVEWGNPRLWPAIWNDPKNADVKHRRGDPQKLQGGDRLWVPNAPPNGGKDIDTATRDSNGKIISGSDGNGYTAPTNGAPKDRDLHRAGRRRHDN